MPAWVLVCNPKKFDLVGMRQNGESPEDWTVKRYLNEIAAGDNFALWATGPDGGVIAFGQITGAPHLNTEATDADYWSKAPSGEHRAVPITITRWATSTVPRQLIKDDHLFAGHTVISQPFAGNPHRLTDEQWQRILELTEQAEATQPETPDDVWHLEPGETIRRVDLHDKYGGSRQGGICPSQKTPNIHIFTDEGTGHQHGYFDRWFEDGTFRYTGEGQKGNQVFTKGNKAIRDHRQTGHHLRLFQGSRGTVRYVGEFVLDAETPTSTGRAPETGGGPEREVIFFHMVRVGAPVQRPDVPVGGAYREVNEDVVPAAATPTPNAELNGRNLRAHRRLQNQLAAELRARGIEPLSPSVADPDFDIAWRATSEHLTVCEIKSLTPSNEIAQLRTGLGQLLDYLDQLQHRAKAVHGVLWIERPPSDDRWISLCDRAGVLLGWPGLEGDIIPGSM
ncbi:hypothetical protein ACFVH6_30485 [Spirillospora sp. NPDC127200]